MHSFPLIVAFAKSRTCDMDLESSTGPVELTGDAPLHCHVMLANGFPPIISQVKIIMVDSFTGAVGDWVIIGVEGESKK